MILNLTLRPNEPENKLLSECSRKLHAPCNYFKILKKSLDARDKSAIRWVYTVECDKKAPVLKPVELAKITKPMPKVVIAGAGPAGLFCAIRLIDRGIRPIIVERGKPVEERAKDIEQFIKKSKNPVTRGSNVRISEDTIIWEFYDYN